MFMQPDSLRRVQTLLVHPTNRQQPDQPLRPGILRIARHASGVVRVGEEVQGTLLLAQFCLDGRGLWLQVANGIRGIHVNGRPVRRMAMLRAGDAVYADGLELVVQGTCEKVPSPPEMPVHAGEDQRMLLRGVGGQHHGRSFTLDRMRLVGRSAEADIIIDDPAFALEHARLERHGDRILLRDLGSAEGSTVNGVPVRHCWLQPGDQVVFDAQHRFVLEVPLVRRPVLDTGEEPTEVEATPEHRPLASEPRRRSHRWPWLLLAALLMAGALASLLLFGTR